ncbi:MAG TPA: hypothetical protein VFY10_12730 [Dehalococcoidia bacterium]|nr:hypothetical protein [Dehalococcoidia bacterium]
MKLTELIKRYVKSRDSFVGRIAVISQELNVWTDEHSATPPTLPDIARFEGLRAERSRLLAQFTETEDQFVVEMLQSLGSSERDS